MILFKFVSKENSFPPVKKTKSPGYLFLSCEIYPFISNSIPFITPARIAVSVLFPNSGIAPFSLMSGNLSVHRLSGHRKRL